MNAVLLTLALTTGLIFSLSPATATAGPGDVIISEPQVQLYR